MTSSTTRTREVRLLSVSDIHFGHRRTKTADIIARMKKYAINDKTMAGIDLLVFVGDFYEEFLASYSDEHAQIDQFIAYVLLLAHHHKVIVRVLEGTRSHDRGQPIRFVTINDILEKSSKKHAQLRYIDTLSVERIEELELDVLWVPDEWRPRNQDTLDEARTLLRQNQMEQVDVVFMHGCFPHQLPEGIGHIEMHDPQAYSQMARFAVFVGHIHDMSVHGNIYAQGSFDRLGHGDESPKGCFQAFLQADGSHTVKFIENKDAETYLTIACRDDQLSDSLMNIDAVVKKTPVGANLRIVAHYNSPIHANMAVVRERWPQYHWTVKADGKERAKNAPVINHKLVYVPVVLDRQSLGPALLERLGHRQYTPEQIQRCTEQLQPFTGG